MTTATVETETIDIDELAEQIARIEDEITTLETEQAQLAASYEAAAERGDGPELTRLGHRKSEIPVELRAARVRQLTLQVHQAQAKQEPANQEAQRLSALAREAGERVDEAKRAHGLALRAATGAQSRAGSIRDRISRYEVERERLSAELNDLGRMPGLRRYSGG